MEKYLIEQMRLQRHDFMNYLQVIYGYIQIDKPAEAINYIKNINKYMTALSEVFNIECDALGIFFQEFINKCSKFNIEIELDLRIEYISCEHFSKDIDKKKNLFDFVTDKILEEMNSIENNTQKLYIYINESPEDFNLIISSTKKIVDEDYYSYMNSLFQSHRINDKEEHYVFYKRNSDIAILLNFN
jgi:hypothetical protein